jgi:hypothetical protein
METTRTRFHKVMRFEKPEDRLPCIEWAPWWDQTLARWRHEGLPENLVPNWDDEPKAIESMLLSHAYFDLDAFICIVASGISSSCPQPTAHGAGLITAEDGYDRILPCLYTAESLERLKANAHQLKERHEKGEVILRLWLDGFFWFPRLILGIERHLYSFFDQPRLLHRINHDLAEFNLRVIEELFPILVPDMVGFAEDMSYNHGPMLSYRLFKEFLLPYYQAVIPTLKRYDVKVWVDSDGDVVKMIPWLLEAGIDGVYPLERQAGVDIVAMRRQYPALLMLGGFDKMVMWQGAEAVQAEFERLLPVMQSGGYILSVDHQTPPQVSLSDYQAYLRMLKTHSARAALPAQSNLPE